MKAQETALLVRAFNVGMVGGEAAEKFVKALTNSSEPEDKKDDQEAFQRLILGG